MKEISGKDGRLTERRALINAAFKRDESSKNEDKRQKKSKNENGMKESTVRNMTSCDLDLHQVNKSIGGGYSYTSHTR